MIAVLAVLAMAAVLLRLLTGWFYALPLALFEDVGPARVLGASRQRARGHRWQLLGWIAAWMAAVVAVSALLTTTTIAAARLVVPRAADSVVLLVMAVGATLLVWVLVHLAVNLLANTSAAVALFTLYRERAATAPVDASRVTRFERDSPHPLVRLTPRRLARWAVAIEQAEAKLAKAYGSYDALIADPEIDAVYIPLPNHLHVEWTTRAAEAGKHVLCEKPTGLTAADAETLVAVRDRTGVLIQEAFMVRTHPQWLRVRELIAEGRIGELRLISAHFSYFQDDPANIRNSVAAGGGGLMDIGCYPVTMSRWLFGTEPLRVLALIERDPRLGIDRLTAGVLEFTGGRAIFNVSTQLVPFQRFEAFGTLGRIELLIPFNAPPDAAVRVLVDDGSDFAGRAAEVIEFPAVDQYTLQGDLFSRAVRGQGEVPVPLEDAIANMAVLDALFRSAETGQWQTLAAR